MKWLVVLPVLFTSLLAVLFVMGRRKAGGGLFRQALPQLLLLIFLSAAIFLFGGGWMGQLAFAPRLRFVLWLLFWFFLLVLSVKALAYFVFDFLVLKRQGVRYPKLVKDVVVFILFIVGVLLILNYYLNIKITVLLASSAVLTVVVGFALQDILGNLFSGIILNFEDSFKIGDWLRIGEHEGRVEQFGWRSFKIRTVDQELIVIPNQSASKAEVMIYGSGGRPILLRVGVGTGYQDSPDRVQAAVLKALSHVAEVRSQPPPVVQFTGFGDSSLEYVVKFWIDDYAQHNPIASEARRRIWYAFRREGIEIPYPKRDVYMKQEPRQEIPAAALAEALRRNDVLRALEEDVLRRLLAEADHRLYGGGETIIREGEEGDHFHHIYSGAVTVLKEGQVIARLGPGDFFGEISLVTGERVSATVMAERESVVIRVSSSRFKEVVDMNEAVAMKLSAVITRRQQEMRDFSERNRPLDHGELKKDSENLFKRILKYFGSKK